MSNILLEFLEGPGSSLLPNVIIVIVGLISVTVCIESLPGASSLYVGLYFFIESLVEVSTFGMAALVSSEAKLEHVVVTNLDCSV